MLLKKENLCQSSLLLCQILCPDWEKFCDNISEKIDTCISLPLVNYFIFLSSFLRLLCAATEFGLVNLKIKSPLCSFSLELLSSRKGRHAGDSNNEV